MTKNTKPDQIKTFTEMLLQKIQKQKTKNNNRKKQVNKSVSKDWCASNSFSTPLNSKNQNTDALNFWKLQIPYDFYRHLWIFVVTASERWLSHLWNHVRDLSSFDGISWALLKLLTTLLETQCRNFHEFWSLNYWNCEGTTCISK